MKYGFLDEAGDVTYTEQAGRNLVVVLVIAERPEQLRKAVTKTRKTLRKKLRNIPELKGVESTPQTVRKLLTHACRIGFDAICVVVDKSRVPAPEDLEDLYRQACAQVVREALTRFGPLSLTLDRRYTKRELRKKLDLALSTGVEGIGSTLTVFHEDSRRESALQVADVVAWTIFQKYERQDETLWNMIQDRVLVLSQTQ